MTVDNSAQAAPPQLSQRDRRAILDRVLVTLEKRFYKPEKLSGDWRAAVEHHRTLIEAANTADGFEQSMSDLLAELHTSHLGFFHGSARRASSRAALTTKHLEMFGPAPDCYGSKKTSRACPKHPTKVPLVVTGKDAAKRPAGIKTSLRC
jgi:hypothetical protein